MDKYKPGYLGKVIPADDPSKMTDFVENKYDSFSKVYEVCKDQSANISDIKPVDSGSGETISVQIVASTETMELINEAAKNDDSVTVQGGVVIAKK